MRPQVIDPGYIALGARIKAYRQGAGISQPALAAAVGCTRQHISNMERGQRQILLHDFVAIAVALRVATQELLPVTWR